MPKNQFKAANDIGRQIGAPMADVPTARLAFALVHPLTLALGAYIDKTTGKLVVPPAGFLNPIALGGNINPDTSYVTTQLDKTSDTALANLVGLASIPLVAGATYDFDIFLSGTAGGSGGWKVAFNYTNATLTSLESVGLGYTASAVAAQHTTTTTTQTSLFAQTAAVIAARITGQLVVNVGGTLAVQFAQNGSNGTASSIYVGSKARFTRTA